MATCEGWRRSVSVRSAERTAEMSGRRHGRKPLEGREGGWRVEGGDQRRNQKGVGEERSGLREREARRGRRAGKEDG
eukprot:729812-Prorocentrum_minimum.AAC.1